MKKLFCSVLIGATLFSCAFSGIIKDRLVDGVGLYCLAPESARMAVRTAVNGELAPKSIRIDCSGQTDLEHQ